MPSDTFILDAFTVQARDIADADIKSLLALSISVGWSHRAEDWEFMRAIGHGQVAVDELGRVHGSAMWFPFGERFAAIGMVITTPRLQTFGGGQWLMRRILTQTQGRALGLHATSQSHRLFLSLGFADEGTVHQYEGNASAPPEPAPAPEADIREFEIGDLPALRDLDRAASGWDRQAVIDALAASSKGMVLSRNGRIEACALIRPFGRGMVIGPAIAASEEDALRVVQPLIADRVGRYVRLDVGEPARLLSGFVRQCGLSVGNTVTRMSLGKPWPFSAGATSSMFALASQSTG